MSYSPGHSTAEGAQVAAARNKARIFSRIRAKAVWVWGGLAAAVGHAHVIDEEGVDLLAGV